MTYIEAEIEIRLFDEWNDDLLAHFEYKFSDGYEIENIVVSDDNSAITCSARTNFDDDESDGGTLAYCLEEDMLDEGFEVAEIIIVNETVERR